MAVNTDVGWSYGYLPNEWANMSSAERARVKAMQPTVSSPKITSTSAPTGIGPIGAAAGFQPYSGTAGSAGVTGATPVDTGVGTDAGSYGATGYAAAPARQLDTAPEWLAYLSALGLEESMARADVDRMRGLYQSEAQRLKQDLIPQYGQQRRGIAGSMETRGMIRSGEYLRRLAENRAMQGRQQAGIEANLAGQVSGLESQLAQKLGSLASQRAQQEMTLRSQGYA
jgi:hypothetical protein